MRAILGGGVVIVWVPINMVEVDGGVTLLFSYLYNHYKLLVNYLQLI